MVVSIGGKDRDVRFIGRGGVLVSRFYLTKSSSVML